MKTKIGYSRSAIFAFVVFCILFGFESTLCATSLDSNDLRLKSTKLNQPDFVSVEENILKNAGLAVEDLRAIRSLQAIIDEYLPPPTNGKRVERLVGHILVYKVNKTPAGAFLSVCIDWKQGESHGTVKGSRIGRSISQAVKKCRELMEKSKDKSKMIFRSAMNTLRSAEKRIENLFVKTADFSGSLFRTLMNQIAKLRAKTVRAIRTGKAKMGSIYREVKTQVSKMLMKTKLISKKALDKLRKTKGKIDDSDKTNLNFCKKLLSRMAREEKKILELEGEDLIKAKQNLEKLRADVDTFCKTDGGVKDISYNMYTKAMKLIEKEYEALKHLAGEEYSAAKGKIEAARERARLAYENDLQDWKAFLPIEKQEAGSDADKDSDRKNEDKVRVAKEEL